MVSASLSIGIARTLLQTDPEEAARILDDARSAAIGAVEDLRSVMNGIYPAVLSDRGLGGAVRALVYDKDPTVDGPLAAGMVLLHGPIARALVATFLTTLTISAARTRLLTRWVLTGNVVLALINLALVPSLFFGMDPATFYASNGWGAVASIGAVNVIWFAILGGSLLAHRPALHAERHPAVENA